MNTAENEMTWYKCTKYCIILTKLIRTSFFKWQLTQQPEDICLNCLNLEPASTLEPTTSLNAFPESIVTAPSLNAFKSRLNKFWKDHLFKFSLACYMTNDARLEKQRRNAPQKSLWLSKVSTSCKSFFLCMILLPCEDAVSPVAQTSSMHKRHSKERVLQIFFSVSFVLFLFAITGNMDIDNTQNPTFPSSSPITDDLSRPSVWYL